MRNLETFGKYFRNKKTRPPKFCFQIVSKTFPKQMGNIFKNNWKTFQKQLGSIFISGIVSQLFLKMFLKCFRNVLKPKLKKFCPIFDSEMFLKSFSSFPFVIEKHISQAARAQNSKIRVEIMRTIFDLSNLKSSNNSKPPEISSFVKKWLCQSLSMFFFLFFFK